MRVIHSGNVTFPFTTLDVTINPELNAIKITNRNVTGQLQLIIQNDVELNKLIENLTRLKTVSRGGSA